MTQAPRRDWQPQIGDSERLGLRAPHNRARRAASDSRVRLADVAACVSGVACRLSLGRDVGLCGRKSRPTRTGSRAGPNEANGRADSARVWRHANTCRPPMIKFIRICTRVECDWPLIKSESRAATHTQNTQRTHKPSQAKPNQAKLEQNEASTPTLDGSEILRPPKVNESSNCVHSRLSFERCCRHE